MNISRGEVGQLEEALLPGYASFLLDSKHEEFGRTLLQFCLDLNVPLMRFLQGMEQNQITKLTQDGTRKLLTAIKEDKIAQYIEETKNNWLQNQLPVISREDVIVEDITLINYARKKAFRELLPAYTADVNEFVKILDEIDRFILQLDSVLFKTYLNIQHEKLQESNRNLQRREAELLEAQSLSKIGSFEWDLTASRKSAYTPEIFRIFEFEQTSNLENFMHDVHPEDRARLQTAIEESLRTGVYECEYRYNRNNKSKVLYSRGKVFFDNGKPVRMVGTVADITEKANLIRTLIENEELSKQSQALTNTGNWKWTIDNDTIDWSDEMYRIYGLEPQSEKITFQRFLTFIHDDDRSRRITEITQAIKTGQASDYIMRIITATGEEKILKGKGRVITDKAGKSIGMLGTCQDITNEFRLTKELKIKNEELEKKNRDLESFNFIASHDLQEPLRKIQVYSNRILNEGSSEIPERLLKYFNKISQASNRMQKMIEDFLIFYHSMNADRLVAVVDLNEVVANAKSELMEAVTRSGANITTQQLPHVVGTKAHLTQMLRHLLSNALKFSKANSRPEIQITARLQAVENGKSYVVLSVSDNGIGFENRYSTRIFELFQRLHSNDEYPGTGIGLSLCKKIAEDHHGFISATSEPGVGSTFDVYLPGPIVSQEVESAADQRLSLR